MRATRVPGVGVIKLVSRKGFERHPAKVPVFSTCTTEVLTATARAPWAKLFGPLATRAVYGHATDVAEESAALGVGARSF